ncbi:MAG: type I-MYXAN CRISPR-associated protein Cas6/Cmx6 [Burkholderiaceae bacterium]
MAEPALPPVVDAAFALRGRMLPRDPASALAAALAAQLPWLGDPQQCGIHRVKLVAGTSALALLSQRTRLILRVPRERLGELAVLAGASLDVDGQRVQLGAPQVHELLPHGTLYAPLVASGHADEIAFVAEAGEALARLGVRGRLICGRRGQVGPASGFSLMIDGLASADSLCVQTHGLGPHRTLGCGVFVAHRSAAALHALAA